MVETKKKIRLLTDLEERCCREYMANGGQQAAAFRTCNPKAEKWKNQTVWARSSELFSRPHVQEYLQGLKDIAREIADKKLEISVERVLREFARIAFSDIRKIFTENGNLINPSKLDDDTAAAISGVEVVTTAIGTGDDVHIEYTHKIKTYDKQRSLENLAKYLHLFETAGNKDEDGCRFKGVQLPQWMRDMIPGQG